MSYMHIYYVFSFAAHFTFTSFFTDWENEHTPSNQRLTITLTHDERILLGKLKAFSILCLESEMAQFK